MRDYTYEKIVEFINAHYIDTDYYLSYEARELISKGVLHLEYIDSLPAPDMAYWLDLDKLSKEENI